MQLIQFNDWLACILEMPNCIKGAVGPPVTSAMLPEEAKADAP